MKADRMLWPWQRRLDRDIDAWLAVPRAPFAESDRIVLPRKALQQFDTYMLTPRREAVG